MFLGRGEKDKRARGCLEGGKDRDGHRVDYIDFVVSSDKSHIVSSVSP